MKLHVESLVDGRFSKGTKGIIIMIFLIVPFISSLISMIHVVRFLSLGNTEVVSITLAITYEIANLTILMAVVLMKKLRAFFVWACFIVLLCIQIVGNVYYSYDYILINIAGNPEYLKTFISFINQISDFEDPNTIIFTLACFLGLPIPMVSLLLVKSVVDYLELGTGEETTNGLAKEEEEINPQGNLTEDVTVEEEKHESRSINFDDTRKLIDEVEQIIKDTPEVEQPLAENSSDMINTEEEKHNPIHLGITIRPKDDNND